MNTEQAEPRRTPFLVAAVLAALALSPSPAGAVTTTIVPASTAPYSVDPNAQNVPVLYLDMTATAGLANLSSFFVNSFGDVPPALLTADIWRDNGDLQFSTTTDTRISSGPFNQGGGMTGNPPYAALYTGDTLSGGPVRYYVTVSLNGVPPARKLSFGFRTPADISVSGATPPFPIFSNPMISQLRVYANPVNGSANYAFPVGGATRSGGLDTGLFVRPGQRVHAQGVAGDVWSVPLSTDAAGDSSAPGSLGGFPKGALVGRVGGGPWMLLSRNSTTTVTSAGPLYVAPEDTNWTDNSGSIRALVEVLPSTSTKIWVGGQLGFANSADIDQNWIGGRPFAGEHVAFDASSYDCDWNIPNLPIADLVVSTAFTKTIRIVPPPFQFANNLTVNGDATIRGGNFKIATSSVGSQTAMTVGGRLTVRDSANFFLGGSLGLGLGLEVRNGGVLTNADSAQINRANPAVPWYFRVVGGTVNLTGYTNLNGLDYADFSTTTFQAMDNLSISGFDTSNTTSALVSLISPTTVSYTFSNWTANPPARVSSGVFAGGLTPGSTVNFLNCATVANTPFGTPNTKGPPGVVRWFPDGGGSNGSISGTLSGTPSGFYLVVAATSPVGGRTIQGGYTTVNMTGPIGYSIAGLHAPATYYVFAYQDDGNGNPGAMSSRGGVGFPGMYRSQPVFVPDGGNPSGINVQVQEWGAVAGKVFNSSRQLGRISVETWDGAPNLVTSTRQAVGTLDTADNYLFQTQSTQPGVGHSTWVFAYVDLNANGVWDAFESSAAASAFPPIMSTWSVSPINIVSAGALPAGPNVTLSSAAVHFGGVGSAGPQPLLRFRMNTPAATGLGAARLRAQGQLGANGLRLALWQDDGDGLFNTAGDVPLGSAFILGGSGISTATLVFPSPAALKPGVNDFFVTADVQGGGGTVSAGVMIDAATNFALTAGTFTVTPGFPVQTGSLPVFTVTRASEPAYSQLSGGVYTGVFVNAGQNLTVTSTGSWRAGPGDPFVGPGGYPGTTGLDTVLPSANRGELIGRLSSAGSSPWFRLGASASVPAQSGGVLFLAMNDFPNEHYDNVGFVLSSFTITGSIYGSVAGQVFYSTPVAGTLTVSARLNGVTTLATSTYAVTASSSYPFSLTGLYPGSYDVYALNDNGDNGASVVNVDVTAGATKYVDVTMYSSTAGAISGNMFYAGPAGGSSFRVGVTTTTDFTHPAQFFGRSNPGGPSIYSITNLPAPATYYVVAFFDGNGSGDPDGPEPFGFFGSSGSVAQLPSLLTPVYVAPGASVTGINPALGDPGAVEGSVALVAASTGAVVIEAGRGVPGTASYVLENRATIPLPAGGSGTSMPFTVGLLRPATGYSLFAYHDTNGNGVPEGGEEQALLAGPIEVTAGGRARVDIPLSVVAAPPPPSVFAAAPATAGSTVTFTWNLVPGAGAYQLRRANNTIFTTLGASASIYYDVLPANTSSQILKISASNANGTSGSVSLSSPVYTVAAAPGTPSVSLLSSTGALVSWATGGNPAGTVYELSRATGVAPSLIGTPVKVFAGTAQSFMNSLAPASTYYWGVRAVNGNGLFSSFSATASAITPQPAAGPALAGFITYAGTQTVNLSRGIVVEVSTSPATFTPLISSAALPGAPAQPWYLPAAAGSIYARAFVDVAGTGVIAPGADRKVLGPVAVAGSSVTGQNFTIAVDTVPPGPPAGVVAVPATNKVTVTWSAPTKSADGGPLPDLLGYVVERASSAASGFVPVTPAALSSTTLAYVDNAAPAGLPLVYRVRALDYEGNLSAPSGAVAATASSGGSIVGQLRIFSVTSGGEYRVRLATSPAANAPSVAEAAVTNYSFTGLADGVYYLRAFRDLNGDRVEDPLSEPAGTFGGLNSPFPIAIVNGNAVTGADATICDRSPLTPPAVSGTLFAGGCPALDKGPGFTTSLFAARVGGGAVGSFGAGTQINVSMSTDTTFENEIIVLGPNGAIVGRDNRVGGANLTVTLSQPGVYLFEPTSFQVGDTGSFQMKARLEGGFAGVLAGSVTYSGGRPGLVYAQLYKQGNSVPILTSTAASVPASFSFAGLPDGVYFLRSYRDSNGNGVRDSGEPTGQFGVSDSSPTPIGIFGGAALGGPFVFPLKDAAVGAINGSALYEGTASAPIRIAASRSSCDETGCQLNTVAVTTVAAGASFLLPFIPPATDYVLTALVDVNGNGFQDPLEAAVSSQPVTVVANSTTTVGLIARDSGDGQYGSGTLIGTATYSGASTGPIFIGLSRDPGFHTIDYLLVLPTTGYFEKRGLQGNSTYYMAGFIDLNLNNYPDQFQGEPAAAGQETTDFSTPTFHTPPPLYFPADTPKAVKLNLFDPSNGSVRGTLTYNGSSAAQTIVVQSGPTGPAAPGAFFPSQTITRVPGVSTYSYVLDHLDAGSFNVNAFVDSNANGFGNFGEPFGGRGGISISSGAGAFPTYGIDFEINDPGSFGAAQTAGRIKGELVYLGTQGGPVYVRFFGNPSFAGTPLYTLRIPATGNPAPGSGQFIIDRPNLPFGTYYLDAFRDPSGLGVYNPAAHAHGYLNFGEAVEVSQERPTANVFGGTVSDPGQGGSVNMYTGSFAAPSGVRFDGGATDLAALVVVDSFTAAGPEPIVFGITAQNEGVAATATRFDNTGAVVASRVIMYGDIQLNSIAVDDMEDVYVPGRQEEPNVNGSTATLSVFDRNFNWVDYAEFPDHQGLDGLSYSTTTALLYASSRFIQDNSLHVLEIDPATMLTVGTGTFSNPANCNYCQSRILGGAGSPDGKTYVAYGVVNQQNDDDPGLHFLIKWNTTGTGLLPAPVIKDVTNLGVPTRSGNVTMNLDDAGRLYLAFASGGDTARTYKYDVSGAAIVELANASYGPINVHFSGGLSNMSVDRSNGHVFEVWESTTGAGDYMLLRYNPSLGLIGQRFFDGFDNGHEDTGFSAAVYNSSMVFAAGAVDNGVSLDWGVLRFNGNGSGSASAAGTAVAITTSNAVSYIYGDATYGGSLVTSGTVRISLTPIYDDVPIRFATAPFGTTRSFLFNNVPDGIYDVRAFIDPNGNLGADEGEPTGASSLYGIEFAAGDSQTLADPVQLCDRRQIAFDVPVLQSLSPADCTSPDRTGAPRRLYTFRGTRGQPVTIAMNALGFYDSYIDLYGPDGDWIEYDDDSGGDGNALISNFVLPEDGVYTIDAGAYGSESYGAFQLSLTGSLGALGSVAGRVNYAGSQGGAVIVGLFNAPAFSSTTAVGRQVLASTRTFLFDNLRVGTTYYLGAFVDVNANGVPDNGEDSGVFGSTSAPSAVLLSAGQPVTGIEIAVLPSTAGAASAAYVTGAASYSGTRTGALVLEFWSNSQFTGRPVTSRVVPTGFGSYDVSVPGGVPYYVRGYIDANADFILQPDEPRGVYAPHGQGAEPVNPVAGQTLVNVDVTLKDPGATAGGAIAGAGTAALGSATAVAGQPATILLTYTAAASTIATGGQIGFTAPPGFPVPNSFSSVTVTSAFTTFSAVTYSGPSAFVTITGAGLAAGETITFEWSNVYVPCAAGASTITVSAVQNGTAAPAPLFLGSPSLTVVPGPASYAALDENYFSVKAGELSDLRKLTTYDYCGNRVPVTSATTIDLAARKFLAGSFVSDPEVGVSTGVVASTAASLSLDFDIGQSSAPFFVLSTSTGFKYLEVHSPLGGGATYYFGVTAVPANALTNVSVSTVATGGVALSSAAIGLAANGQPNQIFVNFTLGDPQQSWHVLVSSLPFKVGERPSAVWERWGYGPPAAGQIAWDGRFSPWINGGARVPNGLYYGRVEIAGGGVHEDKLRLTVALPQFAGRAFDPGTIPSQPLASVLLRVYGPSGYFTATTDSDGAYALPGLGAGNYRLNVSRQDYVDGAVDMTLDSAGSATSFTPRTPGVLVSSNAAGGLDLYVSRAPRLVVVPSLDPSVGAAAADQWGSLQVRSSTSAQSAASFYGPMRLKGGTTTFDDGGQWDSSTQQFIAKTLLGFNVPVGTYSVVADLSGYSRSSATVYVGPDGSRVDLTPFLPKAVISGQVSLGVGNPAPAGGQSVGVSAIALSTSVATSNLSGGAFVNAGSTYALYSISGLDPGAYLLRANTQGLSAASTGPIVVAGTAAVTGIDFPTFAAGAQITGTITVVAPNGTQIYVNAWAPGSLNFGSTQVYVAANSASYALKGLDAGATYQLYANINAQADYDLTTPAGGFPIKVVPTAVQNFTLSPASGVVSGVILLRAGATDFVNVSLSGVTIASLRPDEVGHSFVQVSTTLPNFLCGDGSTPAGAGYCPANVSSATFKVQGVNTQTIDVRMLHSTTGQTQRVKISVVNGSTFTFTADLSGSTYSISGTLLNQVSDPLFNTSAKILANAPYIAPAGYPAGLSSSTARVTAIKQEIDGFGVAISTVFDPISSRVGFPNNSGDFTIPNIPNGVYLVRTTDLRSCATCAVIVPAVSRVVSVAGAAVSSVTLTVSNGYSVSGTISLADGVQDARVFDVSVYNKRQELVRSTQAYLGDANLGRMENSVDYAFSNLPAGEFYTLVVRGLLFPIKYVGRPIKFPDPALSPSGLQSNLVRQDVSMQRAGYVVGRLKDGGTGELINAANAALLAPNFAITATANPWTEGGYVAAASSVSARPIEADGYFRVGPLLPGVSYDLRFAQASWDPNFLSNGSQNYAPVVIGGVKPTPGEIRDLGIVALGQGQSVTGVVKSTVTGLGLGNIKVLAKPSFGGADLVAQTFTNQQGSYSLWVSSAVSNQFSLIAAPRDGNLASDGKYYGQVTVSNVNLQTQTSANFLLAPLPGGVTGQVVVADAASGGALSYPFGDKRGFPAAAINLQPVGIVPVNPLGDIEATTDERGFFSVPGLSTGLYSLHATSLGYAVFNATAQVSGASFHVFIGSNAPSNDLPASLITLARGATATGRILKSDGSAPNSSEVVGVAAANFGSGEFVVGSVETDPVAKTVNAYTISGFKTGVPYNIVLLSGSRGKEVSFPPEGAGVVFAAAESSTTKTINLTYRPATLDCLATAKALDAARSQFRVQVDCLKPLRQQTAADDDLTQILSVSTFTQAGAAVVAPNGTGVLSGRLLSADRRTLTANYAIGVSETRFTMRVRASASEVDPRTGDNFAIDKVFDFYAGLDSHSDGRATNIDGGSVVMNPSAQDELLGLDERSRIDLPPGAFGEGSDTLPDSTVVAQPTTTVNVSMTKGRDQQLAKTLNIAARGYAPAALETPDVPSAYPAEMWAAMSKYRAQAASTSTIGGANPLSAFYSIFLPAGIRHQLKQRADLTLSYSLAASTGTADDKIQVWFYNAVLGRFVLESVNRRIDTVNKTITVSVDHFSTFVVLDSTPVATSSITFGGVDIAVGVFPNPADCVTHSNIARNATLFGSGGVHQPFLGQMIRYSIPPGGAAALKINIYNVAGERVRTIDQGDLPAGQTYYTPWNCANDDGRTVSSGVYIGEVVHGGRRKFFKMAIIKGSGL